jgi:hypothetical protein
MEVKKEERTVSLDKIRIQERAKMAAWIKAGDQRKAAFNGK